MLARRRCDDELPSTICLLVHGVDGARRPVGLLVDHCDQGAGGGMDAPATQFAYRSRSSGSTRTSRR